MIAKKKNKLSSDGRSQKKRPSAAGKKVAEGSRIATTASSKTGTPRLDRSLNSNKSFHNAENDVERVVYEASDTTAGKPAKRKGVSRRFLIGSLTVIVLLVIGTGLLAWNQWFRYDDKADIQGTWVIEGSSQNITFTDTDIVMTSEVSYPYSLDTFQKTITFSFKQYNGSGSYAFSPERTTLIITETDAESGEKVSTKLVKQ